MKNLNMLDIIALVLVIIGGINWGLVGLLDMDLVKALFGTIPVIQKAVYIAVGIAAVYNIFTLLKLKNNTP